MLYISHRGNTLGPEKAYENNPDFILKAIKKGFDAEIDVWCVDDQLFLGHDAPQYQINLEFLNNKNLWCHSKNPKALEILLENKIHCFSHDNDDRVLTSNGFIWVYPNKEITEKCIAVLLEKFPSWNISAATGICSDYVEMYRERAKQI